MPDYRVYLQMRTPLLGETLPSSRTVYGALCWGLRHLFPLEILQETLAAFDGGAPPFVVSGVFPRQGDTLWYPAPRPDPLPRSALTSLANRGITIRVRQHCIGETSSQMARLQAVYARYRKYLARPPEWMTEDVLVQVLAGRQDPAEYFRATLEGGVTGPPQPARSLGQHASLDRLVDSTGGNGQLFYEELTWPGATASQHQGSAFLLVRVKDAQTWEGRVLPALRLMADLGIGGRRSQGRGRYSIDGWKQVNLEFLTSRSRRVLLLSDTAPLPPLLPRGDASRYRLRAVRPWGAPLPHTERKVGETAMPADQRYLYFLPGAVLEVGESPDDYAWYGGVFPYRVKDPARILLVGLPAFFAGGVTS